MRSSLNRLLAAAAVFLVFPFAGAATAAESDASAKPMRLIIPFAPGGASDVLGRILAQHLTETLKRQVVVDNRPGAGGNIAMGIVAKAAPDGNVLSIASSAFVANPHLYKSIPYDAVKDFAPVSNVASAANVLVVHPSLSAKSLKELAALVKATPGKYSYASAGAGTAQHLAGELFRMRAGLDITHVPFNGAGPAVIAVVGNQVPIGFSSLPGVRAQIASGALRAIAVTPLKRSTTIPDVPTFDEAGFPGFEVNFWQGVVMPAGTPRPIVQQMNAEIRRMLEQPDTKKRLDALGFEAVGSSPDEFAKQIAAEFSMWGKFIKQTGIKVD